MGWSKQTQKNLQGSASKIQIFILDSIHTLAGILQNILPDMVL